MSDAPGHETEEDALVVTDATWRDAVERVANHAAPARELIFERIDPKAPDGVVEHFGDIWAACVQAHYAKRLRVQELTLKTVETAVQFYNDLLRQLLHNPPGHSCIAIGNWLIERDVFVRLLGSLPASICVALRSSRDRWEVPCAYLKALNIDGLTLQNIDVHNCALQSGQILRVWGCRLSGQVDARTKDLRFRDVEFAAGMTLKFHAEKVTVESNCRNIPDELKTHVVTGSASPASPHATMAGAEPEHATSAEEQARVLRAIQVAKTQHASSARDLT